MVKNQREKEKKKNVLNCRNENHSENNFKKVAASLSKNGYGNKRKLSLAASEEQTNRPWIGVGRVLRAKTPEFS